MRKIAAALFITMALLSYGDVKSDMDAKLKEKKIEREIVSKGIPISEIASLLQKSAGVKIEYSDRAGGVIVAVNIKAGTNLFDILKELEKNYGVIYIVETDKITLTIKEREKPNKEMKLKEKREMADKGAAEMVPADLAVMEERSEMTKSMKKPPAPMALKKDAGTAAERMVPDGKAKNNYSAPKAGEHDDNEEFKYYLDFMKKAMGQEEFDKEIKYLEAMSIVGIYDIDGNPVAGAEINCGGKKYTTYGDGEALVYPKDAIEKGEVKYGNEKKYIEIAQGKRSQVKLETRREQAENRKVDIVFVMDTTGSMGDEIEILRDTIYSIYTRIKNMGIKNIDVNFGMVLYRDTGDDYVTSKFDLTGNIDEFQKFLFKAGASGGGDYPEQLVLGFRKSVDAVSWRAKSTRMVFAVTDAPDHAGDMEALKPLCEDAVEKNIKMYGIGASGLDIMGEKQLRFISQQTKGKFIFMTYGEKGESDGLGAAGDPGKVSHHTGGNFSSRNLDDIIVDNVKREIYNQTDGEILKEARNTRDYKGDTDKIDARVENIVAQIRKQLYMTKKINTDAAALILPVEISDKILDESGKYIEQSLIKRFADENFIKLVDRSKLSAIYEEVRLKIAAGVKGEIKGLTGADIITVSNLSFIGDNEVLFIKMIDTSTSEVVAAAMIKL